MTDNLLLLIGALVALLVVVAALAKLSRSPKKADEGPRYRLKSSPLLSTAERSFYGVLCQAVGDHGRIFVHVRIADILQPASEYNGSERQSALNKINQKHFDFVLCSPEDLTIRCAIELDDASHQRADRQQRDKLVDQACASAGLPLLRYRAARSYQLAELRATLLDQLTVGNEPAGHSADPAVAGSLVEATPALEPVSAESTQHGSEAVFVDPPEAASAQPPTSRAPSVSPAATVAASSRECPACGKPMLLRTAKQGNNAGKRFWGCSGFPQCRKLEALNAAELEALTER